MLKTVLDQKDSAGVALKKMLRAIAGNIHITPVIVGDWQFDIEVIRNSDQLLALIDEESFQFDERLPYWSELWPSAIALAEYIQENQSDFYNKRVLETGCGLGLCGIAAQKAGADLTLSDNDPLALYFASRNYRRIFNQEAKIVHLDWRGPFLDRKFDMIIGADVIYENRFFKDLYRFMQHHLCPAGIALFAEPQRTIARDFFDILPSEKWFRSVFKREIFSNNRLVNIDINLIQAC
jgi:predicted nicotinamide N-methyase